MPEKGKITDLSVFRKCVPAADFFIAPNFLAEYFAKILNNWGIEDKEQLFIPGFIASSEDLEVLRSPLANPIAVLRIFVRSVLQNLFPDHELIRRGYVFEIVAQAKIITEQNLAFQKIKDALEARFGELRIIIENQAVQISKVESENELLKAAVDQVLLEKEALNLIIEEQSQLMNSLKSMQN